MRDRLHQDIEVSCVKERFDPNGVSSIEVFRGQPEGIFNDPDFR
jgi:hypothetical protein